MHPDEAYSHLLQDIGTALSDGRRKAAAQINQTLVETNWNIGRYIVEYEQAGHEQAEYGSETLKKLAHDLTDRYGKGFSWSNIYRMRQMYLAFPTFATVSQKLSWSHYVELPKILTDIEYLATEKHIKAFTEKINRSFRESLIESVNERLECLASMTDFQDAAG